MTRRTPVEARSIAAIALASLVLASAAAQPSIAHAGGLELLPGGTRSVSRGGAVLARPEDPMVILHNPAMLTALHGDRAMLNIELPLREMCVDLYGYYGWGVYDGDSSEFGDPLDTDAPDAYATTPLPEVCNSADVVPVPSIGFASQLSDQVTIGWGMVAPSVVTG